MTRSHVLLHCPNAELRAARAEAWEGKDPGGVRVLLANPRRERRLAKFLELSGVGRRMADGTDEDGAYAARMDELDGTASRGEGRCALSLVRFDFSLFSLFCEGARTPRSAHSAPPRVKGFFCGSSPAEGRAWFPLYFLGRISLGDGWRCLVN
jgi:hypothetical protein